MNKNLIYFDHASTSPLSQNVLEKINYAYKNFWGNVSSTYQFGIDCSLELESLRSKISKKFNASSDDVIFTSGASESISIVFSNISEKFKPSNLTISSVEHQATIIASNKLKKQGWKINKISVNKDGEILISKLDKYINKETKLVSIIWGQSEIGTLQPVQEIGKKCKELNILFHIDGTQIISNGIFNWNELACDYLSLSAHKFGGPKGIGILLTKSKTRNFVRNNDISITHENSIRQGTQSLPLISGAYQALQNIKGEIYFSNNKIKFKNNETLHLKNYLLKKISENNHFEITGSKSNRLPNHLSFILLNKDFNPIKAYKIVNYMSENNIAISSGSACSSSANKPSIVLNKIGLNESKLFSNIRLSFNEKNTKDELDKFYELILKCINIF